MSPPACPLASAVLNGCALLGLQGQRNPPARWEADFLPRAREVYESVTIPRLRHNNVRSTHHQAPIIPISAEAGTAMRVRNQD